MGAHRQDADDTPHRQDADATGASCTKGDGVKYLNTAEGATSIGLAYSPGACEFIDANPGLVDYVEIPFEQLRHAPKVGSIQEKIPVILHCASMSVAGFVPPEAATLV